MRRTLALCVITLLLVAANAFAVGEARMHGVVTDSVTKQPIPNVTIVLDAVSGKTVHKETKGKADGTYAVFVLDGTLQYKITVSAPGYVSYVEEKTKLKLGEPNKKDVELIPVGAAQQAAAQGQVQPAKGTADPAVVAYNEGAQLANAGQTAEAIAKFEAAVAAKPDLVAAWIALAKTHHKAKNHEKAIEAANKALEVDNEDMEMWGILAKAYDATGDKAKATEARKKLPASAGQLFNDAAKALNGGNDAEGEKLLKQAIAVDDRMSIAYYELGMVYVRAGKSADAKSSLEKYLELDPNGKDAATAKEMMKYLQ
ncbi:MAG TPA: tetratricopeptide repeat protein [Thermoanaerobaculia bacterium]|nr:tetratricopeptide repeat protein [Thermoanaerobaculia bacterium]